MKFKFLPIYPALLLVFLIGIIISCEKEITSSRPDPKIYDPAVSMDVKLAKKYYKILKAEEGDKVISQAPTTLSDNRSNRKYLMFKKAYNSNTNKSSFVEVPLFYNRRPATFMGYKSEFNKAKVNKLLTASFDRLLIYKDKKTGKVDQRIVTYIPDESYLARHNNDASHNQINKLDPDFSGKLVYKNWAGKILFAFKIQNGKRIKTFTRSKNKSKKKRSGSSTLAEVCETYFEAIYEQTCYFTDPEGYGEICTNWVLVSYDEWEECWDDGSDTGTGDDCYDYGINCPEDPQPPQPPQPDPCQSSTSYSKNGTRILTPCGNTNLLAAITDNFQDPCIVAAYSLVNNDDLPLNLQNNVSQMFRNVFGATGDEAFNISLSEVDSLGSNVSGDSRAASYYEFEIRLSKSVCGTASKEYIVETIFHEIYHCYLDVHPEIKQELAQHIYMAENYVTTAAQSLRQIFPTLEYRDASAIAVAGLSSLKTDSPSNWNALLAKMGFTEAEVTAINTSYSKSGTAGSRCP